MLSNSVIHENGNTEWAEMAGERMGTNAVERGMGTWSGKNVWMRVRDGNKSCPRVTLSFLYRRNRLTIAAEFGVCIVFRSR